MARHRNMQGLAFGQREILPRSGWQVRRWPRGLVSRRARLFRLAAPRPVLQCHGEVEAFAAFHKLPSLVVATYAQSNVCMSLRFAIVMFHTQDKVPRRVQHGLDRLTRDIIGTHGKEVP